MEAIAVKRPRNGNIDYAAAPDKRDARPCWGCGKRTPRTVKSGLVYPLCRRCEAAGR